MSCLEEMTGSRQLPVRTNPKLASTIRVKNWGESCVGGRQALRPIKSPREVGRLAPSATGTIASVGFMPRLNACWLFVV